MRKSRCNQGRSSLLAALSPLAAAMVVAIVSTPAMAGDGVAPALKSAMQRDLGLSGQQLAQYLQTERTAARQQKALEKQFGNRYAGSWIERDANGRYKFVVATTSISAQKAPAGVEVRSVRHSLSDLKASKAALDSASRGRSAPKGVYSWAVDPKTNSVVVGIGKGGQKNAVDFIAGSAAAADAIRFEVMTEAPRKLATLLGGSEYISSPDGDSGFYCSVGFPVTRNGAPGFATAGHCSDGETGWGVYVSGGRRSGAVRIGTFSGSDMPGDYDTGPDLGWVSVDAGNTLRPVVYGYGSGDVSVNGGTEAPSGSAVCRSGRTTGWHCGTIGKKDVTVAYTDDYGNPDGTVTGLTQTSACAEGGDSGGSFITAAGQGQGVLSGGSGSCKGRQGRNNGGNSYFSPLGDVLGAYGLTLTTN